MKKIACVIIFYCGLLFSMESFAGNQVAGRYFQQYRPAAADPRYIIDTSKEN